MVVRSLNPVEVRVEGRVYEVRRPTVLQALTVLESVEAMREGDESAWTELKCLIGSWLPLGLSSMLLSWGPASVKLLGELLAVGMPESHESDEKKVKKKARQASWPEVIAEHATAYRMKPEEVLSQPWPFFVLMHAEIDRQRAREQLRNWESAAGAQTGKIDSLIERSDYKTVEEIPESMNDEWYERQMGAARAWRERNKQGEA